MSSTERRRAELLKSLGRTGSARLADLAVELGVSIATVRRDVDALSRQGRLNRRHGSAELDLSPPSGTALAGAVGAMMASDNRYLDLIGQAARREAERRNLRFLLERVETGAESREATARLVRAGCVGMMYSPQWRDDAEIDEPLPWLLDSPVPVVLGGREVGPGHPLFVLDSVIADHAYGMRLAMDHLAGLGHRRIMISIHGQSTVARLIRQSFDAELAHRGLAALGEPFTTPRVVPGLDTATAFAPIVAGIVAAGATAIIVHTDVAADLLAHELRRAGVAVPQDCSVVGYDDIIAPAADLALTTISPPKHQLGVEAVSLLMRRYLRARAGRDRPPVAHVRLLPELIVRRSTARPRERA